MRSSQRGSINEWWARRPHHAGPVPDWFGAGQEWTLSGYIYWRGDVTLPRNEKLREITQKGRGAALKREKKEQHSECSGSERTHPGRVSFHDEGADPKGSSDSRGAEEEVLRAAALQANILCVRPGGEGCCGGCALPPRCVQSAQSGRDPGTHQLACGRQSVWTPAERRPDQTTRGTGRVKLILFFCLVVSFSRNLLLLLRSKRKKTFKTKTIQKRDFYALRLNNLSVFFCFFFRSIITRNSARFSGWSSALSNRCTSAHLACWRRSTGRRAATLRGWRSNPGQRTGTWEMRRTGFSSCKSDFFPPFFFSLLPRWCGSASEVVADARWLPTVALQRGQRLAAGAQRVPAEAHEADGSGEARPQDKWGKEFVLFPLCIYIFKYFWSTSDSFYIYFPFIFFGWFKVLVDFVGRIGQTNVGGKIEDLYFELNKWSFESKFNILFSHLFNRGFV